MIRRIASAMKPNELTLKQRRFIEEYIGGARGNATEAARRAGYSDPEQSGWQNKNKIELWTEIEKRLSERTLSAIEVTERLTQHANGTMSHFVRSSQNGEVYVDLTTDDAEQHFHLLKKVKVKKRSGGKAEGRWEETEIDLEIHDPQAALVQVGRFRGVFVDKTEATLTHEGVIGYDIVNPAVGPGSPDTATAN